MAGVDNEDQKTRIVATTLLHNRILLPYKAEAEQALKRLESSGDVIPPGAKKTLINRWKQIKDVIEQASQIHGLRKT